MNEKLTALLDLARITAVQAGDVAADIAYGVGKKSCELLSVAKLNIRIADRKAEINSALREVGEIMYATHIGIPADSDVLVRKLQEIDALKAEIAQMEEEIGRTKTVPACATCGAEIRESDMFCGACGEKL